MYEQLVQPNLSVIGQPEECLAYVRAVFGATASYPTATSGWDNAQFKHTGTPPSNIAVPVWFSYSGPDGHVAVWDSGTIYSTTAKGDKTFTSIPELIAWMDEDFAYLGWSEDVDKKRVVAPAPAPAPAPTPTGKTINLPANSGAWHLYKPGGPYNPNVASDVIAVVHPADYAPEGITYDIVEALPNGVYRISSPAHGVADIWTAGSDVVIS